MIRDRDSQARPRHRPDAPGRHRDAPRGSLGEHAQAFFLNIPQTSSSAFDRLLLDDGTLGKPLRIGVDDPLGALASAGEYQLVEGPLPFAAAGILEQPLLIITVVRQPVDRVISMFEQLGPKRSKPSGPRSRDARVRIPADPERLKRYANQQTALLGADFELEPLLKRFEAGELTANQARAELYQLIPEASAETLACAKARLERIQFVGLAEAADASVRMLGDLLRLKPDTIGRIDRDPKHRRPPRYDSATLDAVAEANRLDQELYDFAVELFKRRYEARFEEEPAIGERGVTLTSAAGEDPRRRQPRRQIRKELRKSQREAEALRWELRAMEADAAAHLRVIDGLQRQADAARLELEMMRSSRAWRMTRPLRSVANALRRLSR